jgi:hypothetical protein
MVNPLPGRGGVRPCWPRTATQSTPALHGQDSWPPLNAPLTHQLRDRRGHTRMPGCTREPGIWRTRSHLLSHAREGSIAQLVRPQACRLSLCRICLTPSAGRRFSLQIPRMTEFTHPTRPTAVTGETNGRRVTRVRVGRAAQTVAAAAQRSLTIGIAQGTSKLLRPGAADHHIPDSGDW